MQEQKSYARNPISMPRALDEYIDLLIKETGLEEAGIKNVHELSRASLNVYIEKVKAASRTGSRANFKQSVRQDRMRSVAIPNSIMWPVQDTLHMNVVRNVMWYSHASHILNALLRSLLTQNVPSYNVAYRSLFEITIEDLKQHQSIGHVIEQS